MKKKSGKKWIVVLFLLIGLAVPFSYLGYVDFIFRVVEREAPEITIDSLPPMVGGEKLPLHFIVKDSPAGLRSVTLQALQAGEAQDLLREEYPFKPAQVNLDKTVEFDPTRLKEGEVEFVLTARDRSFWGNEKTVRTRVTVDRSKPKLEILSRQHNLNEGGTGLVLFKAEDNSEIFSGVKINGRIFPAFKAEAFDQGFKAQPVFFSFFALPVSSRGRAEKIEIFARDVAGNLSTQDLPFRLKPYKQKTETLQLSEKFISEKSEPLYAEYRALSGQDAANDPVSHFRAVNEGYRKYLAGELEKLMSHPRAERMFDGTFQRLPNAAQKSSFAELRTYQFNGADAGASLHEGLDLASLEHAEVPAAQGGVVIFARPFGIYGNAVVIDHGCGLTTLYGHLSSTAVKEGDEVKLGQTIGRTGATGLAGGDHLHFEIRVHGVSVAPVEWWDPQWWNERVMNRFEAAKTELGLSTAKPLQ